MQIKINPEIDQALQRIAQAKAVSVETLVEEALQQLIECESEDYQQRVKNALSVVGRYRFGSTELAENHDSYFADACSNSQK